MHPVDGGFGALSGCSVVLHLRVLHIYSTMDPFGHLVKPRDSLLEYYLFFKIDFKILFLNT